MFGPELYIHFLVVKTLWLAEESLHSWGKKFMLTKAIFSHKHKTISMHMLVSANVHHRLIKQLGVGLALGTAIHSPTEQRYMQFSSCS